MQLLLLLGVTGKHTRNLSSMRFLVMLTRVPRTKIVGQLKVKELIIIKYIKIIINITKNITAKELRSAPYIFRSLEGRQAWSL